LRRNNFVMRFEFIFFLLIFSLSATNGYEDNDLYNVETFNSSFTKVNADMSDVFEWMDIVAQGAGMYLGPAGGVLPLMVKGSKAVFKPDSDEYKAIKKLHLALNVTEHRVIKAIENSQATTEMRAQSREYSDAVAIPLGLFNNKVQILLQNNVEVAPAFRHLCNPINPQRPMAVMQFFKQRFYLECLSFNDGVLIKNYVQALVFFEEFEKNVQAENDFLNFNHEKRYKQIKADIIGKIGLMDSQNASVYLDTLREVTKTRSFLKKTNLNQIKTFEEIAPEARRPACYMNSAIIGYGFAHAPVLAELKKATYDVIDAALAASFCTSFLNEGSPGLVQAELKEIKETTFQAVNFTKNFAYDLLDSTWNEKLFQATIKDALIDYDFQDNWGAATVKAEKRLNLIGNPRWAYQVLIYESNTFGNGMRCKNIYLCFNTDLTPSVSVYVFRFEKGSHDRAKVAGEYYTDDLKNSICKAIKGHLGDDVNIIIEAMEDFLREKVTEYYYGFALIQQRAIDSDFLTIKAESSPDPGVRKINYQSTMECKKQFFWHAYKVKFFWYL
jgi:hypothetical protein